jgi:putative endonuclease
MNFYVYMLRCADGTFYTGYTNDIHKRITAHNLGKGAKYTKSRRPCKLVWACACDTKSAAMKCEYEVKQLTRKQKLKLIGGHPKNWPTLAGRLNQPLTSRGAGGALLQMKTNGDILSPLAERYLKKYLKEQIEK